MYFFRSAIKIEQGEDDGMSVEKSEDLIEDSLSRRSPVIPKNIIKIEADSEVLPAYLDLSKSPKKQASEEICQSPKIVNVVQLEDTTSPKPTDSPTNDSKYCSNCDISFTYSHTFIAHKQFYCKGKTNSTNNGASPNGSNVSVSLAAETSV